MSGKVEADPSACLINQVPVSSGKLSGGQEKFTRHMLEQASNQYTNVLQDTNLSNDYSNDIKNTRVHENIHRSHKDIFCVSLLFCILPTWGGGFLTRKGAGASKGWIQ